MAIEDLFMDAQEWRNRIAARKALEYALEGLSISEAYHHTQGLDGVLSTAIAKPKHLL